MYLSTGQGMGQTELRGGSKKIVQGYNNLGKREEDGTTEGCVMERNDLARDFQRAAVGFIQ